MSLFIEITGYALADAVNPCAIAILTMVLITVLIANPENKRKVLFSGLAFVSAVFIGYMVYAGILYQLFRSITGFLASNSNNFKTIFGVLAMIIGGLNLKDFIIYKPGSLGTEMPLFMRPKVKRIIKNITSVKGAFLIGFFVTLFLLPCTAGPLVLAAGRLSELTIFQVIPWFIYYNVLFVLPMLIITLIVYKGISKVEEISDWKERNIRKLHLIAGVLLFGIGLSLILGLL